METIREILQNMQRYWDMITVWDVLDVLIATVVIYKLIQLLRKSHAMQILRGIALLLVAMLLSEMIQLRMVNFVLSSALQVGLFALVVLFQPELRKMLESVGASSIRGALGLGSKGIVENVVTQTVSACTALSWRREGALIVFERTVLLDDIIKTGTFIDAEVSAELLKNIFYPKAPLHDGAVVVRNGRIACAACMLPLTQQADLSPELGMRHRAGIGMSETADALVVIVSEETGSVSLAQRGALKRHLAPEKLDQLLRQELMPPEEDARRGLSRLFRRTKGAQK